MTDNLVSDSRLRRFRWVLAAGSAALLLVALWWVRSDESNPKTKALSSIKAQPPLGTLLEPGQKISLWIDPYNLDAPVYTWRVSFQGQIIIKEQRDGRSFTFTPQQFGSYEVSLEAIDGEVTLHTEPVFITVIGEPTNTSTPTLRPVHTPTVPASSPPPQASPTALATSIFSQLPTFTPTLTSTLTFTVTFTPTPTPSLVVGVVTASNLWVRQWPGTNYKRVDSLQRNDKVTILRRTDRKEWLEVMTSRNRRGWVGAEYIIVIQGDLNDLPIWQPPLPSPVKTLTPDMSSPSSLRESVSDWLSPHEQREYIFTETGEKVTIVLLFRPKVVGMKFSVFRPDQTGEVGGGSGFASDQDGDLNTGELIWDSGSLIPNTYYHLSLANESEQRVEFCLARQNDYRWSCH